MRLDTMELGDRITFLDGTGTLRTGKIEYGLDGILCLHDSLGYATVPVDLNTETKP